MPLGLSMLCMLAGVMLLALRKNSGLVLVLTGVVVLYACSITPVADRLIGSLESRHPPKTIASVPNAELIVVLGGGIELPISPRVESEFNDAGDRLYYATQLYKAGKAQKVLLSGGNVVRQPSVKPNAFYSSALLEEWGVPANAIIIEGKSRNTHENAAETRALLKISEPRILLVTSAYHMRRAVALFKKQGLTVFPAPTDIQATEIQMYGLLRWLPRYEALTKSTLALKEYLGYLVHFRLK